VAIVACVVGLIWTTFRFRRARKHHQGDMLDDAVETMGPPVLALVFLLELPAFVFAFGSV
jgi:hypothetical protein